MTPIPPLSRIVVVDIETYWSETYSLSKPEYNTSSYVRDPQFKIQCIGIRQGRSPAVWYEPKDGIRALRAIDWSTHGMACHNTAFDGFALAHHHKIVPCFYFDTLSMTRALHAEASRAKLDVIAQLYGIGAKSKTYLAPTKGKRDLDEATLNALGDGCALDVDLTYEVLKKQLAVYPKDELRLIDLTMRMFCTPILQVNEELAAEAHAREVEKKRALIEASGVTIDELNSNAKFAKLLQRHGVIPPMKTSLKTGHENFAFAQNDPEFIDLLEHEDKAVVRLMEARLAAKSSIGETRAYRLMEAGKHGDKLPILLNYCGAKTMRWSGGNKMNSQNFPRAEYDEHNKYVPHSDDLRRSIIAPRGHVIVVSDSSQIELRTNNWLAGNKRKLDIIRAFDRKEGPDPYRLLASSIYGKPIADIQKMERFIGKVGELGLGFQMGAQKYQTTLSLGIMGPPVDISMELSRKTVNTYRRENKEIVDQWANLKRVLLNMALKKEGHYGPNDLLDYEQGMIWMPNGLSMNYPGLTAIIDAEDKVRSFRYFSHGVWKHIYGGLFCENIVQCLARIIVGEQMLKIAEKYRVVMMTHDEVACVVPKKDAEKALHFMIDEMRKPPSWAPDIPLNAEGGFDVCYSK